MKKFSIEVTIRFNERSRKFCAETKVGTMPYAEAGNSAGIAVGNLLQRLIEPMELRPGKDVVRVEIAGP